MHETAPDPRASPKIPASPPARQELPATGGGSNTALAGAAQGQPACQPAQLDRRAVAQKGQEDAVSWKISSAAELVEASSSPVGK